MPTDIKCPKCGHQFPMEEAVSEEYKKALRAEMQAYKEKKDSELAKRESGIQQPGCKKGSRIFQKLQQENYNCSNRWKPACAKPLYQILKTSAVAGAKQ